MKLNKSKSKSLTYMKWDLIKYSKKLFKRKLKNYGKEISKT